METIIERTDSFYSLDRPGFFVELRDRSINSSLTVGTFESPQAAVAREDTLGLETGPVDTRHNVFTVNTGTDHGPLIKATTPSGFTGQGYTSAQALSAARWYEEQAAKSYCVKPLDEVMAEMSAEEEVYWAQRVDEIKATQ